MMFLALKLMNFREPILFKEQSSMNNIPFILQENKVKKPLVVTDKGIINGGLINNIKSVLDSNKIEYIIYDNVVPNPVIENIENGVITYKENECDCIIAIGGGSPIDCAKVIGARIVNPNKSVKDLKKLLSVRKNIPTFIAIPTTSGTGSECTVAAVVCDSKTKEKYAINDPHLIPKYAILDPNLTISLPKHITSTTGMDALTHAVEAFIGNSNTYKTKQASIKAVKLIFDNLKKCFDNPTDLEARANMQYASYLAGYAFTRAYVGNVHAVAHSLGGFYNIPHGLANAVILPVILRKYGKTIYKKLAILAREINIKGNNDEELAIKFIEKIERLNQYFNLPNKFDCIKEEDIDLMASRTLKEANPLYPVPVVFSLKEMREVYEEIKN